MTGNPCRQHARKNSGNKESLKFYALTVLQGHLLYLWQPSDSLNPVSASFSLDSQLVAKAAGANWNVKGARLDIYSAVVEGGGFDVLDDVGAVPARDGVDDAPDFAAADLGDRFYSGIPNRHASSFSVIFGFTGVFPSTRHALKARNSIQPKCNRQHEVVVFI
ncbi:MAG: hypothetical protein M0P39_09695 [Rhodocyclaceae bacterium]|nr:hypothetical protein [Rhodocyclaceae bacterium]